MFFVKFFVEIVDYADYREYSSFPQVSNQQAAISPPENPDSDDQICEVSTPML